MFQPPSLPSPIEEKPIQFLALEQGFNNPTSQSIHPSYYHLTTKTTGTKMLTMFGPTSGESKLLHSDLDFKNVTHGV